MTQPNLTAPALAAAVAGIALIAAGVPVLQAQPFASKPLELVVHTSPGGGTDQFARLIAEALVRDKLVAAQPQVSNRVGGGGVIAFNYVKGRKGDPGVVLTMATGSFLSALARPDLGFTLEDFTPLAFFGMDPQVIAVSATLKFEQIKDLIEAAKRSPDSISSAIASATGSGRLLLYMLERETGARFRFVAFKSGSEAGTAVAGGHVQITTENLSEVAPHLEAKRVRALAVSGERRMAALPGVPTLREAGIPVVVGTGRGFLAPAGLPREAAVALEEMFRRAFESKLWKDYAAQNNIEESYLNGAQLAAYLKARNEEFVAFLAHLGLRK
jgi:putative tricarboxylic transport membrane protein